MRLFVDSDAFLHLEWLLFAKDPGVIFKELIGDIRGEKVLVGLPPNVGGADAEQFFEF